MLKHSKLIAFSIIAITLILSIGAISAADDTSMPDTDNTDVSVSDKSIENNNLVSNTQDNIKQTNPKNIKSNTTSTININKDNYRQEGWVRDDDDNGNFAITYSGSSNSNDVTFVFEDNIADNLNSIAIEDGENIVITAASDVEFNNLAFYVGATNNVTLKVLKITVVENYVPTGIWSSNIIFISEESSETTIDNVYIDYYLPESVDVPYPASVLDIQSDANIFNSEFIINTYTSTVDWDPMGGMGYGTNNIMPIRSQDKKGNTSVMFMNNRIYINATNSTGGFPTLYAMTIGSPNSVISNNDIEIHGTGWLYAVNAKADYCNITDNTIYVTGTNYTGGIFIEDYSYCLVDNNTIILEAMTERPEGAQTEPVTYGVVLNNYAYHGSTYKEGVGHVINNTITNNKIICTANNMYGIEQFGGDNTTIANNTLNVTGQTAMGIGVIGANTIISGNNVTVNGTHEAGTTVDYLSAKSTGILSARGFNTQITENTINSTFSGILIEGDYDDFISANNIITSGEYSIKLTSTNTTTVSDNYLESSQLVGDNSVYTNTQTNTIENNLPEPTLIETEITITSEVPESIELNELLDIEGYFSADGTQASFESIEVYDNDELIEVIEPWDMEGGIYYTYEILTAGQHEVKFVFKGNDTHYESETAITFNAYDPDAKADSYIDMVLDTSVNSGEELEISGVLHAADDDETPIDNAVVLVKIIINDEVISEGQTTTDDEGYISYIFDTTGVSGTCTVELAFEGNDMYLESSSSEEVEIILADEPYETFITVDTDDSINAGEELEINGIIYYNDENDEEQAVADAPVTLKITIDNEVILEEILTTDDEGMITYPFDTTGLSGSANVELIFEGNDEYQASSDSSTVEIVIVKEDVTIDASVDEEYKIGDVITVNGTLKVADDQTPIADKTLNVNIVYADASRESIETTTQEDGSFTANFNAHAAGLASITITSDEDEEYLSSACQISTSINKVATTTNVNVLNNTLGNVAIAVSVTDENNNPVTQGTITVKDSNDEIISQVEISSEQTIVNIPAENAGKLQISAGYQETDMYQASDAQLEIDVEENHIESQISLEDTIAYINNIATITATVTDADGNSITTGSVVFTDSQSNILGQASVEDGRASIEVLYTQAFTTEVTATYISDSESISNSSTTATLTVKQAMTIIEIDEVNLTAGKTINLTARVYDEAGNNISVGKVVFKINGKTLKDENGKVIYAKVTDGIASIEYTIDDVLAGENITLAASFSGNSKIAKANTSINTTVNIKEATLTLSSPEEVQAGSTVTFTATINDSKVVNTGKIVFKINGKTLKDENGKIIYAKITDNVASIEYTIPESMKAKEYNLTAVLLSSEYEKLEAVNEIKVTN